MRGFRVLNGARLLHGVAVALLSLGIIAIGWGCVEARALLAEQRKQAEQAVPVLAPLAEDSAQPTPEATPSGAQGYDSTEPVNMFAPVPGAPPEGALIEPEEMPAADDILIEVVRRTPHPTGMRRVLIYHTHTWEAYEPTEKEAYAQTQQWRTKDAQHNVVRVGEALAEQLRALGMEVVHDATELEPPDLSTSYTRSLALLETYREKGETFDCYIDLHRDAFNKSMQNTNTVELDGVKLARLSMLIGKGTGQTGAGFEQKPNWEVNIQLAQRITDALNAQLRDLARPVITKSGRFNQHVSESALLIEVGNNKNTLEEALAAMPYLARAIEQALR